MKYHSIIIQKNLLTVYTVHPSLPFPPPLPVHRTRIFIFHFQHKSLLSMCIVMSNIYSVVDVVVWYEPLGRTWLFTLNLSFCSKLFFIQMIQKMIQIRSIEWWSQQTVISSLLFSGRCTFFLLILEISPQTFHSASSRPFISHSRSTFMECL